MSDLDPQIAQALSRRHALTADPATTAYRVFNGAPDGIPGLIIERFGRVLIAQLHEDRLRLPVEQVRAMLEPLRHQLGARAVYRKLFVRDRAKAGADVEREHTSPAPWIGEPVEPEFPILEHGLRYLIRPYDGFSVGLFLEHRGTRQRVRELAVGRRVLNTFAYTCGFSAAAVAGGAAGVSSVDLHRRYLEWGKRNFAANTLSPEGHWFFCSDVFDFYARAERQGRRYDLVILDPPTFARLRRPDRRFKLQEQIGALCAGAVRLLDPGGLILLATNDRGLSRSRLEEELATAAAGRACQILERPSLPVDFAGDPDYSKTMIARLD